MGGANFAMPMTFLPYSPEQSFLLPPSPRDWLPEAHLVYFVSETVDSLDLSEFYRRYEGDRRRNQPFEPRTLVKVLLYAYTTGTFSSRRIARRIEEDLAYRELAAENFPAHRTICEFRQLHLAAFGMLFVQVVRIAREAAPKVAMNVFAASRASAKASDSVVGRTAPTDLAWPEPSSATRAPPRGHPSGVTIDSHATEAEFGC